MVLENATDRTQEEFVREDRFDGGESGTLNTNQFIVNSPPNTIVLSFDTIPVDYRPQVRQSIAQSVIYKTQQASRLLARPVNMEEAQAFLDNAALSEGSRNIGNFIGVSGAIAWASWSSYQIYKRGPSPTPQASKGAAPQIPRLLQFKNPFVRPWVLCSIMMAATFPLVAFQVNGAQYIREMKDPRLADVRRAIAIRARQRSSTGPPQDSSSTTQPETFEQRRQRMSTQEMIRRSRGREQGGFDADDASPTAVGAAEKAWNDVAFEPSSTDARGQGRVSSAIASRRETHPTTTPSSKNESGYDFYDFGDSSTPPTTPSRRLEMAPSSTSRPGSAWERLRQDAFNNNKNDK